MPGILRLMSLGITAMLVFTTGATAQEDEEVEYDETVTVERIVDGDTIRIDPAVDGIDEVRLIGIDTPETKDPDCDVQPYGPEALIFTRDELLDEEVDLEFDEDREDQYDRLLAYVYLDDEMFNETLLEEGYAQVYTVSPNDKHEDRFEEAQEAAQEEELGIWGLSYSEQDLLADRENGIGGEECSPISTPTPPPTPDVPEVDVSEPDVPDPDVLPVPTPTPVVPDPDIPPAPTPIPDVPEFDVPTRIGGADCSTGVKDVLVVPGSKGDRDGDGVACES